MDTSFGSQNASSFSRNSEQASVDEVDRRLLRLMGPRRSSGDGQPSSAQVPRLPENDRDYNGWLPAPRSPTRQVVEVAAPELSSFYNDPSFDIPPSPPLITNWRRLPEFEHTLDRERMDDSRSSLSSSQQHQHTSTSVAGQDAQDFYERMVEYTGHRPHGSNRDRERERERIHVHRLLARRQQPQPTIRREGTPAAATVSSSHRSGFSQAAANRLESIRQLVSDGAPPVASTQSSELNNSSESRSMTSWGDIDYNDGGHTPSTWSQTLRRRHQASLNQPPLGPDLTGGHRDAGGLNGASRFHPSNSIATCY